MPDRKMNELDELIFKTMVGREFKGERFDVEYCARSQEIADAVEEYFHSKSGDDSGF